MSEPLTVVNDDQMSNFNVIQAMMRQINFSSEETDTDCGRALYVNTSHCTVLFEFDADGKLINLDGFGAP